MLPSFGQLGMPRSVGHSHFFHQVEKPRQFIPQEGVVGFDDVVGQLASGHCGVIDLVEILFRLPQVALGDLGHDTVHVE